MVVVSFMTAPRRRVFCRSSPRKRGPSWIPACAGMSGCEASTPSSFASRLQPSRDLIHQRLAQAGMLYALDRLAQKRLDQQSLGFRSRNTAGHQIKLEVVVERARRGAMSALHVVGKDLEFRLVVGFGAVGQKQRLSHHLSVGLLRTLTHN